MFQIKVPENPSFSYDQNILDDIVKEISNTVSKVQKGTLNIIFIDEESIQNLNKNYRQKDSVTDVLSFHYFEDFSELNENDIAGEIVICTERLIAQGKEYGLGTTGEFYKLVIHSTLHILGHDHETDEEYEEMQKIEDEVWTEVLG